MTSVTSITPPQQQELKELHEEFGKKVCLTGCSTAAAGFLVIGALIVITCGCLCLTIPGVNVISQIILPAVVPAISAIVISIPLILLAVKYNQDKNHYRGEMIDKMLSHLDQYKVEEMNRKARINFILKNFLNWQSDPDDPNKLIKNKNWSIEYQGKILGELTEKIGKDEKERNPLQKKIGSALEKARAKLTQI